MPTGHCKHHWTIKPQMVFETFNLIFNYTPQKKKEIGQIACESCSLAKKKQHFM